MPPYAGRSAARTSVAMVAAVGLSASLAAAAPTTFNTGRYFGPASGYSANGYLLSMVAGDFDGDLDPDIAGARENGAVEWWQNTGGVLDGPFSITVPFPVRTLAAGDLNGDGRADLVGCDAASAGGTMAVLLASGAGFAAGTLVPADSAGVVSATLGDLDGDGDLDLVASNRATRRVVRLFNDGAGLFSGLAATFIPEQTSRTWIADLDGDSRPDILTGVHPRFLQGPGYTFHRVRSWVLAGLGGGAFAAPTPAGVSAIMELGAFSAPGAIDAAVSDSISRIGIARSHGDLSFESPVLTPAAWLACYEVYATAIDLNGDGRDEIVGGSGGGCGTPSWGVVRVGAGLVLEHRESYSRYGGPTHIAVDVDGDGSLDVVNSRLLVSLNRAGRLGGTRLLTTYECDGTFQDVLGVNAGDLNGDGAADVVINSRFYGGGLFLSNHDGSFQTGVNWQANSYIRETEIVDLDGDGDRDILQRHDDSGDTDLHTWLNDGTGHQGGGTGVDLPATGSFGLVARDFDGDGDVDALTSAYPSPTLLYLNDGSGNLTLTPCSLPVTGGLYAPVGGDPLPGRFSAVGDSIQLERGIATCTLGPPSRTWVGGTLVTARFADVNNDGRTDAVCLLAGPEVRTLLGLPGGGWTAPIASPDPPIAPGYTAAFSGIGDLDGDGSPDLLFTGAGTLTAISAMRNLGGGVFGERGDSFTNLTFGTVIADVDGDGAGDLLGIEPHAGGQQSTNAANILFGIATPIPTPVLVSLASAVASFDRATLTWQFSADVPATATIERRSNGGGWSEVAQVAPAGDRIEYEDRAVEPGGRYEWRLAWSEDGTTRHSDIASLVIPARAFFGITGVAPNPADGDRVRVMLAIDRAAPVEVRLIDVAGRVVASRRIESPALGVRAVDLGGLAGLRAGLYFVRAEQDGRRASKTVVRLK